MVDSWGQSAGAVSVAMHMMAYDGDSEGLFRSAFMESGGPFDTGFLEDGTRDPGAVDEYTHITAQASRSLTSSPSTRAAEALWDPLLFLTVFATCP